MPKKTYESSIGFTPYSDSFLRKAVLKYQLYLLRKTQLTKRVSRVNVVVTMPKRNFTIIEIEEEMVQFVRYVREWFMSQLNISCRVIIRFGEYEFYNLVFKYAI